MLMSVSSLPLFMLFLFLGFAFLCAENLVHVGTVRKQLPHLITRAPVVGIRRLFLRKELRIFLLQALADRFRENLAY